MSNLKINEDIQIAESGYSLKGIIEKIQTLQDRLNSYSLITAKANNGVDGTVTFTASFGDEFTIPLNIWQGAIGNWLSLDTDNNRIKVLKSGIVKVSGAFEGNFRGIVQLKIYKDGTLIIAVDQSSDSTTASRLSSMLVPTISFYCAAGSYIYFKASAEYGGNFTFRGGRTWLTVERPIEGEE